MNFKENRMDYYNTKGLLMRTTSYGELKLSDGTTEKDVYRAIVETMNNINIPEDKKNLYTEERLLIDVADKLSLPLEYTKEIYNRYGEK